MLEHSLPCLPSSDGSFGTQPAEKRRRLDEDDRITVRNAHLEQALYVNIVADNSKQTPQAHP
jgi:hypothetical protein